MRKNYFSASFVKSLLFGTSLHLMMTGSGLAVESLRWMGEAEGACAITGSNHNTTINITTIYKDRGVVAEFGTAELWRSSIDEAEGVKAQISIDGFQWNIEGDISIGSFFWPNIPAEFVEYLGSGAKLTVAIEGFEPASFALKGSGKAKAVFDQCHPS